MSSLTAFEKRRRRIPVHKRDLVLWSPGNPEDPDGPGVVYNELHARIIDLDRELANAGIVADPLCESFLEWYADEWHKYGRRILPGLAALYWRWAHLDAPPVGLSEERYEAERDRLAAAWPPEWLDTDHINGGKLRVAGETLLMEFIWYSAGDWIIQRHLVEAVVEFDEFQSSGKMREWRRRKRRRTAAARRKQIKLLYERELSSRLDDLEDDDEAA